MVKPKDVKGPLPTTREGYSTAMKIAWPSIVESVLVALISSVDTMMVGGLGPDAIAAVGITTQPKFIFLAAILSFNIGVTAVAARRKGAGDQEGANRCLKQGILISMALSLVFSLGGIFFAQPVLRLAGASDDYIAPATTYFQIIMAGTFFSNISLTINAAQRGIGNTQVSMRTNLAANVINLIFNYFLINGIAFFPRLGVAGAGIATALGNLVAFVMSVRSVWGKDKFLSLRSACPWRFDKKTTASMLNVSGGAAVEQVFLRIGFFLYAAMVANLGTTPFATHQICMNVINISFAVGDGFSIAASSLAGQSLGGKRPDIAKIYVSICQRIAFLFSTILFFLFIFGRYLIVGLFTDDAAVLAESSAIMIIIACTTHIQTSQVIISGCLRGAGDTKYVAISSFVSIAVIRPLLTYALCFPAGWGLIGAWISLFLDQACRLIANLIRFRSGKWTQKQL